MFRVFKSENISWLGVATVQDGALGGIGQDGVNGRRAGRPAAYGAIRQPGCGVPLLRPQGGHGVDSGGPSGGAGGGEQGHQYQEGGGNGDRARVARRHLK